MTFWQFLETILDELCPLSPYPTLKEIENRHIVRTYLLYANQEEACRLIDICNRTLRNRLNDLFPSQRLMKLPGSGGRKDLGALISFVIHRMNESNEPFEIPAHLKKITHWRLRRSIPLPSRAINKEKVEGYPSHRDFNHFDWYYNLDSPRLAPPKELTN